MTRFHAVMIDETGCEFGAEVNAHSRAEAYAKLKENYPESRCDQLESPTDAAKRERRMYQRIQQELDDPYSYHYGDYE
jgi:hypothetical protein